MDEAARKAVLRLFTYGLYALTTRKGDQVNACTVNWLTQVSFDPPLIALSVENTAVSLDYLRSSGTFAVCVFAHGQRELAGRLGRSLQRGPQKLENLAWLEDDAAMADAPPVLAETLGFLRCAVESETPAGDSTLLVARITDARLVHEGEPLTMREAGFRHSG
jgi:flavin reductase (DIM6/NTAB) family NADH-FMN oxidoreductase RutF